MTIFAGRLRRLTARSCHGSSPVLSRSSTCCSNPRGYPPSQRSVLFPLTTSSQSVAPACKSVNIRRAAERRRSICEGGRAAVSCLCFPKQHLSLSVVTPHHLFPSERFPAGRRLLQLLQQPDGAAAEAERRADGVREPSDRGEERSEEPHAALGGGAAALSADWSRSGRQCRIICSNGFLV